MTSLQSQILKTQGINWVACIFWGILIGGIILALNNYREPILAFIAKPTIDFSWINNLTLDKIVAFLKDYGVLFSAAGIGVTFIYGFYQKHQASKAALELATTQQMASSEINTAYSTAETYRKQAETYKTQLDQSQITDSQGLLKEATDLVLLKNKQMERMQIEHNTAITTLQNEIDRLKIQVKEVTVVK